MVSRVTRFERLEPAPRLDLDVISGKSRFPSRAKSTGLLSLQQSARFVQESLGRSVEHGEVGEALEHVLSPQTSEMRRRRLVIACTRPALEADFTQEPQMRLDENIY